MATEEPILRPPWTETLDYENELAIAWYSHAGLQAGDVISTGTPAGVALGYKGPGSWYLKAGDVVEAEVQGIGVLRNPVRERPKR